MILNTSNMQLLYTGLSAKFEEGYQSILSQGGLDWTKVADEVPSSTSENLYPFFGSLPSYRKWMGDRHIKNVERSKYSLKNETFELSFSVFREEVEDDLYMAHSLTAKGIGVARGNHPNKLIFGAMADGDKTLCYDGQFFFDADHPVGSGVVSNIESGAGPAWYLLDTRQALKPFIFQKRRDYSFQSFTDVNERNVFMTNQFVYGSDARVAAGYGFWQQARMSKAALNSTSLSANIAAMSTQVDSNGDPLGVRPNLLVCGFSLREAALQAVKADTVPWAASVAGSTGTLATGGNSNVNKNVVDVLITPWLP